jgi:hypothetical protein
VQALDRRPRGRVVEPRALRLGRDEGRADGVHAHAVRRHARGERARQRHHAALRRGVRVEARDADQRVGRRRQDDRPAPLREHLAADVLADVERAGQDEVEHPLPDGVVELGQASVLVVHEAHVDRAVVEDVDRPVLGDGALDHRRHLAARRDVGRDGERAAARVAEALRHGLAAGRVDLGQDDGGALAYEGRRGCAAEARAGARHDRHLPLEPSAHVASPVVRRAA